MNFPLQSNAHDINTGSCLAAAAYMAGIAMLAPWLHDPEAWLTMSPKSAVQAAGAEGRCAPVE